MQTLLRYQFRVEYPYFGNKRWKVSFGGSKMIITPYKMIQASFLFQNIILKFLTNLVSFLYDYIHILATKRSKICLGCLEK